MNGWWLSSKKQNCVEFKKKKDISLFLWKNHLKKSARWSAAVPGTPSEPRRRPQPSTPTSRRVWHPSGPWAGFHRQTHSLRRRYPDRHHSFFILLPKELTRWMTPKKIRATFDKKPFYKKWKKVQWHWTLRTAGCRECAGRSRNTKLSWTRF